MLVYVARRLLIAIPQMLLILVVTFVLIRMLPGDPARLQLGPLAPQAGVDELRREMRLDEPLPLQFVAYLERIAHGDFGNSWVTGSTVLSDVSKRLPATLELLTLGLLTIMFVMVPLGTITASRGGGILTKTAKRIANAYGLLAGAFPDFWLGLLLLFVFFTTFRVLPGPEGRLSIGATPPSTITGMYTVDYLLHGDLSGFVDALSHMVLPVATMALVYGAVIYKTTWSSVSLALRADFTTYVEGFGLPRWKVLLQALRAAAPPVVVMTGVISGYLLGGAVLIETVFNLNGIGQYAVQSVVSADYAPLQAFVLFAAFFTMAVYLVVDIVYIAVDPRVRIRGRAE
jgi:ABC-type dipeptide/oligopeptide/nickel transport system permease component